MELVSTYRTEKWCLKSFNAINVVFLFLCSISLVQDLINLQKLQNLSIFQHPQLGPQLPGLSNHSGNPAQNLLNSPLNLSLAGHSSIPPAEGAMSPQLPQLILASGQLIQGIQGAQLLIPTSQGKWLFCSIYLCYKSKLLRSAVRCYNANYLNDTSKPTNCIECDKRTNISKYHTVN